MAKKNGKSRTKSKVKTNLMEMKRATFQKEIKVY